MTQANAESDSNKRFKWKFVVVCCISIVALVLIALVAQRMPFIDRFTLPAGIHGRSYPYKRTLTQEELETAKRAIEYERRGSSARMLKRWDEAEKPDLLAIQESTKIAKAAPFYLASELAELANLYKEQGKYKKAEPLFKRSIAVYETEFGPNDPGVALNLQCLGWDYQELGRYAEADAVLKRSLAIYEKEYGSNDEAVAGVLGSLADLYTKQKKYTNAEPLLKRSIAISEINHFNDYAWRVKSWLALAQGYEGEGKDMKAEEAYKRALRLANIGAKDWSPSVLDSYVSFLCKKNPKAQRSELEAQVLREFLVPSYEIYMPKYLHPKSKYPLIIGMMPDGNGHAAVASLEQACDANQCIALGSNDVKNAINSAVWAPCVTCAIYEASKKYPIDLQRVYLSGFSGGGMATYLYLELQPKIVQGLIVDSGMMPWASEPPAEDPLPDDFPKGKHAVLLANPNHFRYEAMKKNRALLERKLGWKVDWVEFISPPGPAPPQSYMEAVRLLEGK